MAMSPSSKFQRMKLKPSQTMAPKAPAAEKMAMPPVGGTVAKSVNPKLAARRKAMKKMTGGM